MSDTPRTDTAIQTWAVVNGQPTEMVTAEFARQLERDLRKCAAAHMRSSAAPEAALMVPRTELEWLLRHENKGDAEYVRMEACGMAKRAFLKAGVPLPQPQGRSE
jgi:hypothetical protein